jgi:hypothetical protein
MAARFAARRPLAALSSAPTEDLLAGSSINAEDLLAGSSIDVEAPLQEILITPLPP